MHNAQRVYAFEDVQNETHPWVDVRTAHLRCTTHNKDDVQKTTFGYL
ncbi:hypothetical protein HMPREF3192_01330 [Atopobium deltae]|uniref:Uncharacterized protein n=1 Tax=Atopobium deltae TaxID=1393034 RepID=A0A133XPU2_9ACTN|nr:hypothetical protein HMPREF3192_01330 [Atopobium deltae]